ncbi:MAG: hypothetical protein IJ776_04125 [Paludibacteraceae bacterium]|nr:hypothetical protein [Paludibacteraceae bacterium]
MKKNLVYIYLCLAICLLEACTSTSTTTYTPSDDPTVDVLTLANDSFPELKKAVFKVEERIDTGLIYNVDSIQYGTKINKVVPKFVFSGNVVSAAIIFTPDDTVAISGGDTIDFSKRPVYLHTISESGNHEKWYEIQVNVHQTDPDLYQWELLADNIFPPQFSNQKAVMLKDTIFLFVSNGLRSVCQYSPDGKTFVPISGPFDNFDVQNTLVHNDTVFCLCNGEIAMLGSATGGWTKKNIDDSLPFTVDRLLLNFVYSYYVYDEEPDSVWALVTDKSTGVPGVATTADFSEWVFMDCLPADFPVSDFAAVSFFSPTGRPRAMVIGGFSAEGACLNTRWNMEYESGAGYRWENFSIEQPDFTSISGASVIAYDKHFLMFGGANGENNVDDVAILESFDEGMNWTEPDSAHNHMPETYTNRAYQSVLVDSNQNIYVIGGKSRTLVFSDVYKGRLNSINW